MSSSDPAFYEALEEAVWPKHRPAPLRTIRCRHCRRGNRVAVSQAVLRPSEVACGGCKKALFLTKEEPLEGLSSTSYQHSLDRRTLAALESVPGVPRLVRAMLEKVGDRSVWFEFMADAVRCGDDQFPELVSLMDTARRRLGLSVEPTLFLGESPHMNALTTGVKEPVILVRSALLDQMNDEELVAILGHELGHLHAHHPLYLTVAHALFRGGAMASQAVRVLAMPIQRILLRWSRFAELTADRAALLSSRSIGACISTMLTFAGGHRPGTSQRTQINMAAFIRQCRELARLQAADSMDRVVGGYLAMDRTHPQVAWRVMHLIQWVEHGAYLTILSGSYPRAPALTAGEG